MNIGTNRVSALIRYNMNSYCRELRISAPVSDMDVSIAVQNLRMQGAYNIHISWSVN